MVSLCGGFLGLSFSLLHFLRSMLCFSLCANEMPTETSHRVRIMNNTLVETDERVIIV